ncbi:energy transducer TonB [Hymenobacter sp. BT507]|uniref:Energy transducer TonB n=1 Tax=Hymenobacter citatus TaxID=2763506 RepID=A0ABR7MIL2_9BACT|nr:energy transducer TonB [Hymenobacter citatus]MBC6610929.1 energy transducer TonB [Hymenobacter citatus]
MSYQLTALLQVCPKKQWFLLVLVCTLSLLARCSFAQMSEETRQNMAVAGNASVVGSVGSLPMKEYDLPINLPKPVEFPRLVCFFGEPPEFPGGFNALLQFIGQNIRYPADTTITGRVFVSFVITETGQVANVRLAKGLAPAFDEEALRVIKSMPNWNPGRNNGKPVSFPFTVPIGFAKDLPPPLRKKRKTKR